MFTDGLVVLNKMAAIVSDINLIDQAIAALEMQIIKWSKLNRKDVIDTLLDELSAKKEEKYILEELAKTFFGCGIEDLQLKMYTLRAALERQEEALIEQVRITEAYNILKKSDMFKDPEFDESETHYIKRKQFAESILEAGEERIKELVPASTLEILEESYDPNE